MVALNLDMCRDCTSKACAGICNSTGMGQVLKLEDGVPALRKSPDEIKRGGCTECLGCELDCILFGKKAVNIHFPMPEYERYAQNVQTQNVTGEMESNGGTR